MSFFLPYHRLNGKWIYLILYSLANRTLLHVAHHLNMFLFAFTPVNTVTQFTFMKDIVFFSSSILLYILLCILGDTGNRSIHYGEEIFTFRYFMFQLCNGNMKKKTSLFLGCTKCGSKMKVVLD